tara:strand:- start:19 stop:288 length:270 start_codon:yes stop_codon:yes gene_type:complete
MDTIQIGEYHESDLHLISKWRSNPKVNKFIRPGMRTLGKVQLWCRDYFSEEANKLFLISCEGRNREARVVNDEYKDVLYFSVLEHEWTG